MPLLLPCQKKKRGIEKPIFPPLKQEVSETVKRTGQGNRTHRSRRASRRWGSSSPWLQRSRTGAERDETRPRKCANALKCVKGCGWCTGSDFSAPKKKLTFKQKQYGVMQTRGVISWRVSFHSAEIRGYCGEKCEL